MELAQFENIPFERPKIQTNAQVSQLWALGLFFMLKNKTRNGEVRTSKQPLLRSFQFIKHTTFLFQKPVSLLGIRRRDPIWVVLGSLGVAQDGLPGVAVIGLIQSDVLHDI